MPPANENLIVGISFSGTVSGISGSSSWASDLKLTIVDPLGGQTSLGGFSNVENDWDFQGSDSTDDGNYQSGPHLLWSDAPLGKDGETPWTLTFTNDWDSEAAPTMSWSQVEVTFHKVIPAPGTLGLMLLVGAGRDRRRRG